VVDTTKKDSVAGADKSAENNDGLTAPDPSVVPPAGTITTGSGSSSPAVGPADLDALRSENLLIPVAGVAAKDLIDSFDDMRSGTRHHNALDIMAARNTPVLSATDATVIKLHNSTAGGLTIYSSDPSSKYVMMYGHLDSFRPGLKEGDKVKRGQIIGFVGSTGNASPLAPHLHFQVTRNDNLKEWWKGTPLNPFLVFRPKG
jgi:murein DD-endopeptidase MepM/ murein hydrolase activator NlpD